MNRFLPPDLVPAHLLRPRLRGLYVVTDEHMGGGHLRIAAAALAAGAAMLQLRDKTTPAAPLLPVARQLRAMTHAAGALFIINDRIDLALASGADGVHLGPADFPLVEARRILGPHRLLGASCGDAAAARSAERAGADYLGVGAVFGTATKTDAGSAIGLEALRRIVRGTGLPVAAIGGVNRTNIAATVSAGAAMACVVSAVALAGDHTAMRDAALALIQEAGF